MALPFSEKRIQELVTAHLSDGETLRAYAYAADWPPLWKQLLFGLLIILGGTKYYAVGVKERGLILVQMNATGKVKGFRVIPWNEIREVSYRKAKTLDTLSFVTPAGERFKLSFQNNAGFMNNRKCGVTVAEYVEKWSQLGSAVG